MLKVIITAMLLPWPVADALLPLSEKSELSDADIAFFIDEFLPCWSGQADEGLETINLRVKFPVGPNRLEAKDIELIETTDNADHLTHRAFRQLQRNLVRCQGAGGYPNPNKNYVVEIGVSVNINSRTRSGGLVIR